MKKFLAIVFLLSLIHHQLLAEVDLKVQNAKWLISINGENFFNTNVGKSIKRKIKKNVYINQKLMGFKLAFGVDLFRINNLSVHGSEDGILTYAEGGLNSLQTEGFVSLLRDVEIYKDKNPKIYIFNGGAFSPLSEDKVVFASEQNLIAEALEDETNGSKFNSFIDQIKKENLPVILVGLNFQKKSIHEDEINPDLKSEKNKLLHLAVLLSQSENKLHLKVFFQAKDNDIASHVENVLRGYPSFLALLHGSNQALDEVLTLFEFSIVRVNDLVSLNVKLNID